METPPFGLGVSIFRVDWRTLAQPIRTAAIITSRVIIEPTNTPALYQKLSEKAKQLKALGMSTDAIAKALGVSPRTVQRACGVKSFNK